MSNFRNVLHRIWQYRFGVLLLFFFIVAGFIGEYSFYQYWSLKRQNMDLAERIDQ